MSSVPAILLTLAAILAAARLFGELAERVGQPAVLGELLAGVVLGPSLLGLVAPDAAWLDLLAQIGVVVLLFQIGIETDLGQMISVGGAAAAVAMVGVALPFALGYAVCRLMGFEMLPSIVAGAALTATSVGITARVLSDLGRLRDRESQVVLGAAVLDDVVGLVILGVVAKVVAGSGVGAGSIGVATIAAFGFLIIAVAVGRLIVPPLFALLGRLGGGASLATAALALAFAMAALAHALGSALIIGAFAAGLALAPSPRSAEIARGVTRLGHFFVPIFFVAIGAAVNVGTLGNARTLATTALLIAVAVAGKLAAGYAPFWFRGRKLVVGAGMIPRGEVGLIFAQTGLAAGVLSAGLFSSLTVTMMATTFLAPPLLKALLGSARAGGTPSSAGELVNDA